MKDRFIEMLMHLFDNGLEQAKESDAAFSDAEDTLSTDDETTTIDEARALIVRSPSTTAMRVFTYEEQIKLTKASYQFLMRLSRLGIIAPDAMEMTLHYLMLSESRLVSLSETKWTLRNILGEDLEHPQLAFLDLVLYQKEDEYDIH